MRNGKKEFPRKRSEEEEERQSEREIQRGRQKKSETARKGEDVREQDRTQKVIMKTTKHSC